MRNNKKKRFEVRQTGGQSLRKKNLTKALKAIHAVLKTYKHADLNKILTVLSWQTGVTERKAREYLKLFESMQIIRFNEYDDVVTMDEESAEMYILEGENL